MPRSPLALYFILGLTIIAKANGQPRISETQWEEFRMKLGLKPGSAALETEIITEDNFITINGGESYNLNDDDLDCVQGFTSNATCVIDGTPKPCPIPCTTFTKHTNTTSMIVTKDAFGIVQSLQIKTADNSYHLEMAVERVMAYIGEADYLPTEEEGKEEKKGLKSVKDGDFVDRRNLRSNSVQKYGYDTNSTNDGRKNNKRILDESEDDSDDCASFKVAEIAIAFDSTFCDREGGELNAIVQIKNIVALASISFQSQGVCIKTQVSYIEGHCDPSTDPYLEEMISTESIGCDSTGVGLMHFFKEHWNAKNRNDDSAHLFYNRELAKTKNIVGCANINRYCNEAIGVDNFEVSTDVQRRANLFAHEFGHNLGLYHPLSTPSQFTYIMKGVPKNNGLWTDEDLERMGQITDTESPYYKTCFKKETIPFPETEETIPVPQTENPTSSPTKDPTNSPTSGPTSFPTTSPTILPTTSPTNLPTTSPTSSPTTSPTSSPTTSPTSSPTTSPTSSPTTSPTSSPTTSPTSSPMASPTRMPTKSPTKSPTTSLPTTSPTSSPTTSPTKSPMVSPSSSPTTSPTSSPMASLTRMPTKNPTKSPTTSSPTTSPTSATGAFGDPHIRTWSGMLYDFHGVCDLVLLSNPNYKDSVGMYIHIRNKRTHQWSYIDSAAVRIGNDILEVIGGKAANSYWINGEGVQYPDQTETALVKKLSGHTIKYKAVSEKSREFVIDLNDHDNDFNEGKILLSTWNKFVRVNMDTGGNGNNFIDSIGLMGRFPDGKRLGRDKVSAFENDNEFGQQWQVLSSDPKLFRSIEGPQYPTKCEVLSSLEMRRRLVENTVPLADAQNACSRVKIEDYETCVFDVMATNNKEIAKAY